jgi:hypothetical protein
VAAAYRAADLTVEVEKSGGVFARFAVADEQGRMAKVELGCDWRARPPAVLEIGPVLHPDDAVADKVTTLFGRAAPRDSSRRSEPKHDSCHQGRLVVIKIDSAALGDPERRPGQLPPGVPRSASRGK